MKTEKKNGEVKHQKTIMTPEWDVSILYWSHIRLIKQTVLDTLLTKLNFKITVPISVFEFSYK